MYVYIVHWYILSESQEWPVQLKVSADSPEEAKDFVKNLIENGTHYIFTKIDRI